MNTAAYYVRIALSLRECALAVQAMGDQDAAKNLMSRAVINAKTARAMATVHA